jgi:glucose-1-phosphate thymidylyltransferase
MEKLIGLIPAAGQARRLTPLPCSKELIPVGFFKDAQGLHPKPVGIYLLERLTEAGIRQAFMIVSKEKSDIQRYYGNGDEFGISIAYLIQENPKGMPNALDLAYSWTKGATVVFGMPDTIFNPHDAFVKLLENHFQKKADVTLGLFPTQKPERFGMVSYAGEDQFIFTIDKPKISSLRFMWGMGCWSYKFTEFLHQYLNQKESIPEKEVVLGDIFQAAHEAGILIKVVPFLQGEYVDIGSLDDLVEVSRRFSQG